MSTEVLPPPTPPLLETEAPPCSPRAPRRPGAAASPGSGRLGVALVEGCSAVIECAAASPLHLFAPCARGRSASIIVATYGGGLVAGDSIDLSLDLGRGAAATVGTQSETKVYRSEGSWARQRLRARIGAGAALAVVPEPASCFAGARYRQHQEFELHPAGSLLLVDAVTAGRTARAERWAFDAYLSRNDVRAEGRPLLQDAVRLVRGEGPPVERRMGRYELLATVVLVGPALAPAAASILASISARAVDGAADVLAAASPLRDGVYLRAAAATVEAGMDFVRAQVALAAAPFGRHPLERRS